MAEYRRPFAEPAEGRRPTLTWPRQIPIEGEPADVHAIATEYADWLGTSNVPKLFLKAEPGAILANDTLVNLIRGWPALTEKTVAGIHSFRKFAGRDRAGHRRLDDEVIERTNDQDRLPANSRRRHRDLLPGGAARYFAFAMTRPNIS